jgi:polysaccharide pyruvyl transferase WcaK-like protein
MTIRDLTPVLPAGPRPSDLRAEMAVIFGADRRRRRLLLIGNYGNGNLGDDGILLELASILEPWVSLTVASRHADRLRERYGLTAVSMTSSAGVAAFLRSDVVAIGGGGLFGNEMQLMPQLLPLAGLLAARLGKDTMFVAIGAYTSAPLWVQRALRRLAARSRFVSARDMETAAVLDTATEVVLVDDPGTTLDAAPVDAGRAALAASGVDLDAPLLGVSLKPTRYGPGNTVQVAAAVAAIDYWQQQVGGQAVLLCLSERSDNGMGPATSDERLAEQVKAAVGDPDGARVVGLGLNPRVLKSAIGELTLMIGHRLHAQIYATAMGVPAAGFSYERKSDGFADANGLTRFDLWTLRPDAVVTWIQEQTSRPLGPAASATEADTA